MKGVCWDERVSPPDGAIKSINLSQSVFAKVLLFRNLSSKIWNLQPNSLINDFYARRSNSKGLDYYLLLLLLKSKVKRLQPFQIDIKPSEVPGGAYSYWLSLSIKALFLSMYVVAWQSIVFDEMWNIRNSLLFPPQKDDNWQGQGKGAEAVRKFWRFTRQSCTTSRYRCIVW